VFVATILDGVEERLLKAYKFDLQRQAAQPISEIMVQTISGKFDYDIVTWVPTASFRIRERGFDHAAVIAQNCGHHMGLSAKNVLDRFGRTRQLGATRAQRIEQMKHAFSTNAVDVAGKRILLIDDVMTTGASMASAARILKNSGAKQVDALVYAQKM